MVTENDCLDVQASDSALDEENAALALVKFLISRNISFNDSDFRTLLKTVGKGCCNMVLGNSLGVIEKCLWKIEHEIEEYKHMVMESWKTTGCTLMLYNLNEDEITQQQQHLVVLGFYCPKGFIFAELRKQVNHPQILNYYDLENGLKTLVPDSCYPHVKRFLQHTQHRGCQYHARDLSEIVDAFIARNPRICVAKCIRQQVLVLWRSIYDSNWPRRLINYSDELFEVIVNSHLYSRFYKTVKRKEAEQVGWGKDASHFTRLCVVMELKTELKAWISQLTVNNKEMCRYTSHSFVIRNHSEGKYWEESFWGAGSNLVQALTPLFELPCLFDTLVPSAGYVGLAIEKVRGVLTTCAASSELLSICYRQVLGCFEEWRVTICADSIQEATSFLSPAYLLRHDVVDLCPWCLYDLAEAHEDPQALDSEIKAYSVKSSNPFANITISECDANHPVTLWSKYGGGFPLLQKCAYKLLSQPSCCLCNQVDKHVSKLKGTDNYVLRLNALMMEEFANMGDPIYRPIHI